MILDEIVNNKKLELSEVKSRIPLSDLERRLGRQLAVKSFSAALVGDTMKLIAEVKKASPSKGLIAPDFDPVNIAGIYALNGASAISILTESRYFLGSLTYLDSISRSLGDRRPPLLRKDFLFDHYQIIESRVHGADAILLITAILKPAELREFIEMSHGLGMEALIEVHDKAELDIALSCGAGIIGINNRDLRTFEVDLSTTERLSRFIPADKVLVSESGIKTRSDINRLRQFRVNAVLVGESLMSSGNIAAKMKELL